jgi:hypothetical protein
MPETERPPTANEVALLFLHLPLFATISAFLFLAIRVGRVSGSDPGTTLTLLRAAGLASVLVGTLIAFLPALAMWTVVVLNAVERRDDVTETQRRWAIAAEGAVVTVATLLMPVWSAALIWAVVILFLVQAIRRKRRRQRGEPDSNERAFLIDWAAVATGSLAALFFTADPWLPAEIVVPLGKGPEVAYVVESDSVWTTLMLNDGRTIQILRTEDIESRSVCDLNGGGNRSLLDLLDSDPSDNPRCPDKGSETQPSPTLSTPVSPSGGASTVPSQTPASESPAASP